VVTASIGIRWAVAGPFSISIPGAARREQKIRQDLGQVMRRMAAQGTASFDEGDQ